MNVKNILKECLNLKTLKTKNYFVEVILFYTDIFKIEYLFKLDKQTLQDLCYNVVIDYKFY